MKKTKVKNNIMKMLNIIAEKTRKILELMSKKRIKMLEKTKKLG